ncbi:MAG: HPr(Ser) kinase/phosphatase [Candidatus Stygibacter australis]|nr:HPr(Ser) kinase/phosphatase [Candidatus Stygibacter australis]MDP8321875.1 HPr(Ser) kinase/phosphatase [Candidatus Stygibacter australis]
MKQRIEYPLKKFYNDKKQDFKLSLLTHEKTLSKSIKTPFLNRPGLALTGYYDRFSADRVQILGETEISYLQSLEENELFARLREMLVYDIPCIVVTKGLSAPRALTFLADEYQIPVFITHLSTNRFYNDMLKHLDKTFAEQISIHGVLVEVFGVGMLISGASGIGKSECALDLVDRGHRMVCDDLVTLRSLDGRLVGMPRFENLYTMEIRGIGLVDIEKMYGIHGVRKTKEVDIQVELMKWDDMESYQRLGLQDEMTEIMGIKLPIIYLPVTSGKNLSVIMEVIAMNHSLRSFGYNAAEEYTRKLNKSIMQASQANKELENNIGSKKD